MGNAGDVGSDQSRHQESQRTMKENDLLRAEEEARLLLSKYATTPNAQAIEHFAGAILLSSVTIARAILSAAHKETK
jgi:hypothetical protein